jgi:WD40 repeat protein
MPDVFVSYSRRDEDFVRRLVESLEERGKDVWRDKDDIPPAVEWREEIRLGIDGSHVFTFVISPDSLGSGPCGDELAHAVDAGKTIVPLVRRRSDGTSVPDELKRLNYVYAREDDNFDHAIEQILATIDGLPTWERTHTRLLERAGQWDAKGRDGSLLLRGSELRDAEQWSTERPEGRQPTPLELDYILASRKGSSRRLRMLVVAAFTALAVTAILAVVALLQRNEATRQRNEAVRQSHLALSRALASGSTGVADRRLDLASLLALEAYRTAPTPEARGALVTAVQHADRVQATLPGSYAAIASGGRGRRLATISRLGTTSLWDLRTARRLGVPIEPQAVSSVGSGAVYADTVALARDGRTVATDDPGITIWDGLTGRKLGGPTRSAQVVDKLAFSRSGTRLAGGGVVDGVTLWTVERRPRGTKLTSTGISDFEFRPDGSVLAGVGTARIDRWRVPSGRPLRALFAGPDVWSVAFSPDGTTLASGDAPLKAPSAKVELWKPPRPRPVRAFQAPAPVWKLAFADARNLLALAGTTIQLVDVARPNARVRPVSRYARGIVDLVPTRSGSFATRAEDGTVRLWSLGRLAAVGSDVSNRPVSGVAISPDGRIVAAVQRDGSVSLWNPSTWRPAAPPIPSRGVDLTGVAFAGNHVVVTGGVDGLVKFTDLRRPRGPAKAHKKLFFADVAVSSLAASANGNWAASVSGIEGAITIWDLRHGHKRGDLPLTGASAGSDVAFSPDGRTLAVATRATAGNHGSLGLWDVRTRRREGRPLGFVLQFASALAFSRDGRLLASGEGGTVRLWDVADRRPLPGLLRVGSRVSSVSFSRDGATLAVGSANGVSLWDVASRNRLGEPLQTRGPERAVAFSKDGRTLASDGRGLFLWNPILWSRSSSTFTDRLCQLAGRQLTQAEWRQFLPGEPYHQTCPTPSAG